MPKAVESLLIGTPIRRCISHACHIKGLCKNYRYVSPDGSDPAEYDFLASVPSGDSCSQFQPSTLLRGEDDLYRQRQVDSQPTIYASQTLKVRTKRGRSRSRKTGYPGA